MSEIISNRIKNIEDYSREELVSIANNEYGIDFFPNAKNPSKPSKSELAEQINETHEDMVNPKPKEKKTRSSRDKDRVLKRVIVTEMRKIESFENDDDNRCVFITWGNDNGHFTNKVIFNNPWHLPVGCINNLENVTYTPVGNKGANVHMGASRKAYKIEYLDYLDSSEIKEIGSTQKLRASSS